MLSTSFKLRSCAIVLLISIIGLATASFQGSSACGIQIHRASGLVLWCESQPAGIASNNTIYIAPMNSTSDRVAIFNYQTSPIMMGASTTATPYLDETSGQIMIVVSSSTSSFPGPNSPPSTSTFHILSGSVQDVKTWTTVYNQSVETETLDAVQTWINGVFLFGTLLDSTNKNISYKAFVPSNNGFSFVEVFSYSATAQNQVRSWTMDGTSRLCLALNTDESSIVCRSLTNSSTDSVIHSDANSVTFTGLVSDNNGRIFWGEFNGTSSLRIWAANSDKTDTPAVIDRTTNTTYVTLTGLTSSALQLGYDSYNKLVYWTENIAMVPNPSADEYTFGVFGWDGKTSAVVTYFVAENTSMTVNQICTYNGQMMLTSTIGGGFKFASNVTRRLYHTSASSAGTPASALLFTHLFQGIGSELSIACDPQTGWAVASFSDTAAQIGSSISAIRIDNTTSMSVEFSADVNITLGFPVVLTDGVIGYTLIRFLSGSPVPDSYDLLFYTLPVSDVTGGMPSSSDNTPNGGGNNTPNTNSNTPSGKVSFANQLLPFTYFASLAYLFL